MAVERKRKSILSGYLPIVLDPCGVSLETNSIETAPALLDLTNHSQTVIGLLHALFHCKDDLEHYNVEFISPDMLPDYIPLLLPSDLLTIDVESTANVNSTLKMSLETSIDDCKHESDFIAWLRSHIGHTYRHILHAVLGDANVEVSALCPLHTHDATVAWALEGLADQPSVAFDLQSPGSIATPAAIYLQASMPLSAAVIADQLRPLHLAFEVDYNIPKALIDAACLSATSIKMMSVAFGRVPLLHNVESTDFSATRETQSAAGCKANDLEDQWADVLRMANHLLRLELDLQASSGFDSSRSTYSCVGA